MRNIEIVSLDFDFDQIKTNDQIVITNFNYIQSTLSELKKIRIVTLRVDYINCYKKWFLFHAYKTISKIPTLIHFFY